MTDDIIEEHNGFHTITRGAPFSLEEVHYKAVEMGLDPIEIFIGCADGGFSMVCWTDDDEERNEKEMFVAAVEAAGELTFYLVEAETPGNARRRLEAELGSNVKWRMISPVEKVIR